MRRPLIRPSGALFGALLLLSCGLRAQDVPAFFIQRITVTNVERISPAVIVSESRLREGQSYSEEELREANDRIRRLPFVLDATFALQKGDARDRYVLAISVSEAKPLFFLFDLVALARQSHVIFDSTSDFVLGARYFVGSRGAIHFGYFGRVRQGPVTSYSAFQAGYTQYDLFGSRAFATIAANQILGYHLSSRLEPEIVVGVPLSPKQTVTASYIGTHFDLSGVRTERTLDSRWSYNTTNHPFFPTRGTVVSAAGLIVWRDAEQRSFVDEPVVLTHSRAFAAELIVKKYWELPHSNSLAAEIGGGFADVDRRTNGIPTDFSEGYGKALVRLSHPLRVDEALSQSRLELTLHTVSGGFENQRPGEAIKELSVSWARRKAWGALRFGVGYAW